MRMNHSNERVRMRRSYTIVETTNVYTNQSTKGKNK